MLNWIFMKKAERLLPGIIALSASIACAGVFEGTPRTVTVGNGGPPSADFATLFDAANDFNSVLSGINGSWGIEIDSDLTEPENLNFTNTMNSGASLVIQPKSGTKPTITFSQTTTNAGGHGGQLIIGGSTTSTLTAATSNVTIEGSNGNAGDGDRDLTIQNDANSPNGTNKLIAVTGDSVNVAIRNCIVKNLSTKGTPYGIVWKAWRSTNPYGYPNNGLIENCEIDCVMTGTGRAIATVAGGSAGTSLNTGITGWVIRNNDITGGNRGIGFEADVGSADIYNNRITVNCTATGNNSRAFTHEGADSAAACNINIYNNVFTATTAASTGGGIVFMDCSPGNQPPASAVYNIYNNVIAGVSFSATTSTNLLYIGIRTSSSFATLNCFFNSIHLANQAGLSGETSANAYAIGDSSSSFAGIDWRDNLIRVDQAGAACLNKNSSSGAAYVSDYNDLSAGPSSVVGALAGADKADLSTWKTDSGADANSISADPTSMWVSPATADLHLNAAASSTFNGIAVSSPVSVSTDIDGESRPATPVMGADEYSVSAVAEWTLY
jgi:hypothetical protein